MAKKSRAEIGSGNVYRDRSCSEILNTNTDEASYSREHRLPSCNRGRLRGLVDRGMADFVEREIVDERERNYPGYHVRDDTIHGTLAAEVEVKQEFAMEVRRVELCRVYSLLISVPVVREVGLSERLFAIAIT